MTDQIENTEALDIASKFFPTDTGVEQPETQLNTDEQLNTPEVEKKEDEGGADAIPASATDDSEAVRKIKAEISARTQAKREAQSDEEKKAIAEEQKLLRIALARTVAQEKEQRQLDTDEDEYDEEDLQLITKYAKKLGFVTKAELEEQKQAELAKQQELDKNTKITNAFTSISKDNPVLKDEEIASHIIGIVSEKLGSSVNLLSERALLAEFEDTLQRFGINVTKEATKIIPKTPQFNGAAPGSSTKVLKTDVGEYDLEKYKTNLDALGLRF